METALCVIGFFGLIIGIIMSLIYAVKRNPRYKKTLLISLGCLILLTIGGAITGNDTEPVSTTTSSEDYLQLSKQNYIKGIALFNNKDYKKAIEAFNDVIPKDPNYKDAQTKLSEAKLAVANSYLSSAKTQLNSKDYENALNNLNKAISYNPNLAEASNLIPVVQQQQQAYLEQLKQQEIANYKSSCQSLSYKVLNKNPDGLIGTKVMLHGQILQIQEDAGSTFMLLQVTYLGYDTWTDNVAVAYSGTIDAYEDDVITVWGEVSGAFSYKSQAGWDLTVPGVKAKYIQK